MILLIFFMIVQFCNAQVHRQPPTDKPQLSDELPFSSDFYEEVNVELPPLYVSQPEAIQIPLPDEDIESLSNDLYEPVYTLMCRAEVHQNIANPEPRQQEFLSTPPQETIMMQISNIEQIDMDLGTLLACGDLGPVSIDDINIEALSFDIEMEAFVNDTCQFGNASTKDAKHHPNTSDAHAYPQTPAAFYSSSSGKVRNVDGKRDRNMACPTFGSSACGQQVRSGNTNSSQSFVQSGFFKSHFINKTDQKPFQCDICAKQFSAPSTYQRHRRIHTGEKSFQCDICSKHFRTSKVYQTHRRIHTGEKPFKCDFCQKKFSDRSSCQRHRRTHTGEKPFQCDICAEQFSVSCNFQRHRRIHTGEKPLKCNICPKQFRTSDEYQKHQRTHTGEKPFKCNFCQKEFSDPSNYRVHRRIHTGEKPFLCEVCKKQFRTSMHCKRHRRTHTVEKPFKCNFCQKEFSDSSNYQVHRRIHTAEKPFLCEVCKKQFRTSFHCERHRRTHTREMSHICFLCNQEYRSKRNLIDHVRKCLSRNVSHTTDSVVLPFINSGRRK